MGTATASERLACNVRELREKRQLSFRDLEAKLREHGKSILASGLLKLERGERRTDVDELIALAATLGVGVPELLGLEETTPVERAPIVSSVESVTRNDLAELGELSTLEPTLVETAFRLAAAIDQSGDDRALPGLTKELRATIEQLAAGRRRTADVDEDEFADLDEPE